jgi:hypothetical protein
VEVFGTPMFILCKKLKHVKIASKDFNKKFFAKFSDRVYFLQRFLIWFT